MAGSVAVAGASASDYVANDCPDSESNANGLIRIITHNLVCGPDALDSLVSNLAIDFFATFQCGGQTLAGIADFFTGHVGGGGHQGARIIGESAHVITDCLCLFVHKV